MSFIITRHAERGGRTTSSNGSSADTRDDSSGMVGRRVDGGEYVEVGGEPIWHFMSGESSGTATVLLHGAFASASVWGAQVRDFVESGLRVYLPERPGHGHTPDDASPFSYDRAVAETIAYLDSIVGGPAHLIGWSDGAVIAARVAATRPDLVNRMILVGQMFHGPGRFDDPFFRGVFARNPSTVRALRRDYEAMSPDGSDHFDVAFGKIVNLISTDPGLDLGMLSSIPIPTLVVQGDRDSVAVPAAVEVAEALPRGRVAVLPGTQILPIEAPELFNPLVLSFLAADPPSHWEL